jgi:hypothetical protein
MNSTRIFFSSAIFALLLAGSLAQAASVTGTVTNKTNNKPSGGDTVALVDVGAGMSEAATATTDANGHYSLNVPGAGPYLIRANHQGGTYFIAAPQGGGSGDITVYDVAAKVEGIGIDADMILAEAASGTLRVQERYLVRNTSLPPRAQLSSNTFEIVLPPDAVLEGASVTRPAGMATNIRPVPLGQKSHYTFNIPIQPNQGEKETLFELDYHIPYSGNYTFAPQPQMPTDNLVVYLPKGIAFSAGKGATFQSVQEDARVQTYVAKNVHPGQTLAFTLSGEGQMPREAQNSAPGQQAEAGMGDTAQGDASSAGNRPGGGIGNPIGTPDPLSKYKWWILAGFALLLAAGAAVLLRKQATLVSDVPVSAPETAFEPKPQPAFASSTSHSSSSQAISPAAHAPAPPVGNVALLHILKDELFTLESEKLSGVISAEEYAEVKTGLEVLLKRALKRSN